MSIAPMPGCAGLPSQKLAAVQPLTGHLCLMHMVLTSEVSELMSWLHTYTGHYNPAKTLPLRPVFTCPGQAPTKNSQPRPCSISGGTKIVGV